jgi:predicted amino acid-binding ACT domain protein
MEADQMIFKAILEPLIVDSITEVFKKQRLNAQEASQNLMDEEFADTVIVACNRFCK